MSQPTTGAQVVKNLEYVEEATYGTTPTNPAMIFLAESAVWSPGINMTLEEFARLGSEDPYKILTGREEYQSTLTLGISNSTFIKYGINARVGAGTIDKALSIALSYKINNVENFVRLLGSRINEVTVRGSPDNNTLQCTATVLSKSITTPSTTDFIGIGTHATASTAAPFTYTEGGVNPVTWGGTVFETTNIEMRVARNLDRIYVMGAAQNQFLEPTNRRFAGTWSVVYLNTTPETDLKAGTAKNLVWTLKSAISTITVTNAKLSTLDSREFNAGAGTAVIETYGVLGESIAVT